MRDDTDYRALQEQAHLLQELTTHDGWAVLVDYIEAISRAAKLRVLNGQIDSIDDYKRVTGELIGLHKAIDAPKVVQQMLAAEQEQRIDHEKPLT